MSKKLIAPSLLSSDFADLKTEIAKITEAGAHLLHVDVMDGHFVPNITIGMPVVKAIKGVSTLPLDVHLMIDNPEKYIEDFAKAGSDYLTIHVESTTNVQDCLLQIRKLKMKPGITLRPKTKLDDIKPYLALVDLILIMTVEPGFGGQSFMHDQLEKVSWLKSYRDNNQLSYLIEIDGGVNEQTAQLCWEAGADVLVAGSAVFAGEKSVANYRANIQKLL